MSNSGFYRGCKAARVRAGAPCAQRGAALIIGLVLLLAMTVLGISGMSMSTLELTMAGNMQSHQRAFECAETGIDRAITEPALPGGMAAINEVCGDGNFTAQNEFVTTTLPPDGAFSTDIAAYHFDIESAGTGPRNAASTHTQSFYVIGPAIN